MKKILIFVVVIVFAIAVYSGSKDRSGEAVASCQVAVKEKMKDPSSASFEYGAKAEKHDNYWTVSGKVTAKNSFGANVRSVYMCKVTEDGKRMKATVLGVR